jgi:hypothetical protein
VAYQLACWLVRDLRLSDGMALAWLGEWDQRNRVPKGQARLKEIIASAHAYGTSPYGCGLSAGVGGPVPLRVTVPLGGATS